MTTDWLHKIDDAGRTPLLRASQSGRSEFTTVLMMQEAEDQPSQFPQLPTLHRAACWGFEDAIEELVADGAEVDEEDSQGETALHKAVRLDNPEAARRLLDLGANASAQDASGMTPLHWASFTGNLEMVELLLSHYADVSARDYCTGGTTPAYAARVMGHDDIATLMQGRYATF